ncbi:50S ribosomal protein L14 [Anoxybacter fermentans]|uniref:50S ribosomal protein L14 n=1 Tax=Anoxybacter fermentans TaxID=1323375 RepID=A0A3Q9HSG3_9FIRM|nr:KOW domain-containing RNA-binding protein [Anoxybacter fermentans]AZR74739.1 50S ribosomal protein L14 [Anoxybacter fermentans]
MVNKSFQPGQLVSSCAGRDRGRYFVVIEVVNDSMVKVVDGDLRRVEKPKLKNTKHLIPHNKLVKSIAEKLKSGQRITNEQVRLALKETLEEQNLNKEV